MPLPPFVIPRFDPRRITGLAAWYDAADASSIVLDGGRVSAWRDKSGNLRHATNSTSGSTQPSYTTAGRNGLNVASFSAASSQRLQVPSSTSAFKFLHDGTPSWWILAGSYGASANPNATYMNFATNSGGSGAGMYYAFEDSTANGGNNGIDIAIGTNAGLACGSYLTSGYPASTKNIITPQTAVIQEMSMDVSNATLADRAILRINGGSGITFNTYSGTPTSASSQTDFMIGALSNGGAPLQGELYEMRFFNRQLSPAECDYHRRDMGAKWGINVA